MHYGVVRIKVRDFKAESLRNCYLRVMTMTTQPSNSRAHRQTVDFGVSMDRSILENIDKTRGDTARSLWLKRLAIRELERLHKLEQPDKKKIPAEAVVSH